MLLVLHASREPHTAADVHRELKTSRPSIERRLLELESSGLLARSGMRPERAFRYEAVDDDVAAAVDELAVLYPAWRTAIVSCIFQISP